LAQAHIIYRHLKHNTLNELLLMQFYLFNIRPELHRRKLRKLRVLMILSYTVSKFARFLRHSVYGYDFAYEISGNFRRESICTFPEIPIKLKKFYQCSVYRLNI